MFENSIFLFSVLQQNVEKEKFTTKYHKIWLQRRQFQSALFESKILRNATNIIVAIIFEIAHLSASESLSLQRIGAISVEKLFSITRLHAKMHQTMSRILEGIEVDQVNGTVHATRIVRRKKSAKGKL
jgi:hypothetical protein